MKTILPFIIIVFTCVFAETVFAELKLPSGADRRPNLSLDPFERAREANRSVTPREEAPAPQPATPHETPPDEPAVINNQQEQVLEPISQEEMRIQSGDPVSADNSQASTATPIPPQPEADEPEEAFSYEIAATVDSFTLTAGGLAGSVDGIPEDSYETGKIGFFGTIDFVAELKPGGFDLWDNGTFFLLASVIAGTAPAVGDFHGISGVYGGGNTMRIVELWYEHEFPFSHSAILFGLHDFNGDFYVTEYAGTLLNGSFGMGTIIGNGGNASTFPTPTTGLRLKTQLNDISYLQAAIYDGAASEEAYDKLIEVKFDDTDGFFLATEAGIVKNEPGDPNGYFKVGLGAWYLRQDQFGYPDGSAEETPIFEDNPKPGNNGYYFIAESSIGENLGIFFKHGRGRKDYNQFAQYYATGLSYQGVLPSRGEDVLSLGLVHTRQSADYLAQSGVTAFVAETTYEITYTTQITDWLMVQPDVQYITQPSMSPDIPSALVLGLRLQAVY